MVRVGVMQMVDALAAGGLERVAVNLANLLPRELFTSYLCTTREEGPLANLIAADVSRLRLDRARRFELKALLRLSAHCRTHNVQIIHAHGTALLFAVFASLLPPFPKVIWHVHYGALAVKSRPAFAYWLLTRRVAAILAVNDDLAAWSRDQLRFPADRVHYLRNFVCEGNIVKITDDLPGVKGHRIVCVANLRPQKDHLTLVRAIAIVAKSVSAATLLIVGAPTDADQLEKVEEQISRLGLQNNVHILGSRQDVVGILAGCDIGVLSSVSEGLPLALIEYGMAGLAAVATDVGQCSEVMDGGGAGLLVPPGDSEAIASALLHLLEHPDERAKMAGRFNKHVMSNYTAAAALDKVCKVYEKVLAC